MTTDPMVRTIRVMCLSCTSAPDWDLAMFEDDAPGRACDAHLVSLIADLDGSVLVSRHQPLMVGVLA